jgi:hypothetical protein
MVGGPDRQEGGAFLAFRPGGGSAPPSMPHEQPGQRVPTRQSPLPLVKRHCDSLPCLPGSPLHWSRIGVRPQTCPGPVLLGPADDFPQGQGRQSPPVPDPSVCCQQLSQGRATLQAPMPLAQGQVDGVPRLPFLTFHRVCRPGGPSSSTLLVCVRPGQDLPDSQAWDARLRPCPQPAGKQLSQAVAPGRPRHPLANAASILFQVSPGAATTGPEARLGQLPVSLRC